MKNKFINKKLYRYIEYENILLNILKNKNIKTNNIIKMWTYD